MSKKGTRALASATLMSLVLTTALSAGPVQAAAGQVTRTSGLDRYATAASVATANWTTSENVVLVNGENYPDAVSASALAKKLNAPILLTKSGDLNADAKAAISKLGAKNIYVIGGEASVSTAVRTGLKANYSLVELGGQNRYETNIAVAKELVKLGVKADNVLLVGGEGFSDALSVAPVAAAKGQILLLGNNNDDSMKSVVEFIKANSSKVTVVGTVNVISDAMYNTLGAVERVNGGASRFDTNLNVLNKFAADLKADKLFVANASGNGFADALVASALAGKTASPLVLVDTDSSDATTKAVEYIKGKATKTTDLNVIGGVGVVSEKTVTSINKAVNPDVTGPVTNGENTVSSVTALNLNQFEVTFNCNIDEDTAELAKNYKVAGSDLNEDNAHVEKINDNTVKVTLVRSKFVNSISQNDEKTVTVKKGILTEDKSRTIEKSDNKVTFKDIEAPTLKNVSIKGNNKLVIEFSEAVNMKDLSKIAGRIQINGKNLPSYADDVTYNNVKTPLSQVKEGTKADGDGNIWASKVEFYFNSKLSTGENTIKVKDADGGVLVDAAGFSFKATEETVTVDGVSTKPTIQNIKATDNGKIYIKFDRAMDSKTALNKDNYSINDKNLPSSATVEIDSDDATDSTIKIKHVGDILKDNSNILEIQDSLKDAYGNKIEDETRKSFDKEKDETKPTVLSATVIDNKTLRVQFSEDVKYSYATNVDNYQLKDASDVDVMHTDKSKIKIVGSNAVDANDIDDTDTYDIKFNDTTTKLDSSKYSLTVKNVVDIANEPNKIDDQTLTVDGDSDQSPSLDDINAFKKSGSDTEVAIYFGKEMDSSSLTDKSNYFYINGDGDSKELPDDVDITVSADNKSVVLDFDDANKKILAGTGDDQVKRIGIKNAKDANGNEVYVGALTIDPSSTGGPKFETDTLTISKDGDDVIATIQLDTPLDDEYATDFYITSKTDSSVKIYADSIDTSSKKVTLTFNEGTNADKVMALGTNAELTTIASPKSNDIAGRSLVGSQTPQQVYYYGIAPETDRDKYSANITVDGVSGAVTGATVSVRLKTKVDETMKSAYLDDFDFTYNGSNLDATDVKFVGTTLVFTIDDTQAKKIDLAKNSNLGITVTSDESDIDLRSPKDLDGKTVKFVPSSDDKKVKTITIEKATVVNKTDLTASIAAAETAIKDKVADVDYTAASLKAVTDALVIANDVKAKDSSTQADVNTAKTNLDQAVKGLTSVTS